MTAWTRTPAQIALAALLLGSVLLQVLLPLLADELGGGYDETRHLVVPYAAAGIAAVACVQVAIGAVWWLLRRVGDGSVLTPRSLVGVDVVTGAVALAALVAALPLVHLLLVVGVGGPGVVLALAACLAAGVALTSLVRVMRGLLADAIADRAELEEVV